MLENTKTSHELQIIPRTSLEYGENRSFLLDPSEEMLIKNFSTHPVLKNFFEGNPGFLSLQWVTVGPQDAVSVHTHEVDTLLISCRGGCLLVGDGWEVLHEGDTVFIPRYFKHGLISLDNELFWGLSLRFYDTVHALREG